MREITIHKSHDQDRQPKLTAMGHIGTGGSEQLYRIEFKCPDGSEMHLPLDFISLEHDGVTNEALLAVVIDRLEGFQAGPFNCTENAVAQDHARAALNMLHARTMARIARGVENQATA